jgi:hypothetical protein
MEREGVVVVELVAVIVAPMTDFGGPSNRQINLRSEKAQVGGVGFCLLSFSFLAHVPLQSLEGLLSRAPCNFPIPGIN